MLMQEKLTLIVRSWALKQRLFLLVISVLKQVRHSLTIK